MTVLRTLLVDGTDLRSLTGVMVTRLDLFAPATRRGDHEVIPGRRGQIGAELELDAYPFGVAVQVDGGTDAQVISRLHTLAETVRGTKGLVALERRLPNTGGTYDASTADGAFVGFSDWRYVNDVCVQVELTFMNLDGAWWNGTIWQLP